MNEIQALFYSDPHAVILDLADRLGAERFPNPTDRPLAQRTAFYASEVITSLVTGHRSLPEGIAEQNAAAWAGDEAS